MGEARSVCVLIGSSTGAERAAVFTEYGGVLMLPFVLGDVLTADADCGASVTGAGVAALALPLL